MKTIETGNTPGRAEAGHTPGPWRLKGQEVFHQLNPGGRKQHIAFCYWDLGRETNEANARLIASAPELLAALKLVRHSLTPDMRLAMSDAAKAGVIREIDAALARAEGGGL